MLQDSSQGICASYCKIRCQILNPDATPKGPYLTGLWDFSEKAAWESRHTWGLEGNWWQLRNTKDLFWEARMSRCPQEEAVHRVPCASFPE